LTADVRERRQARGWSQERLAGLAGITRQSLAALETGASVPSTDVALRLARALDTTVESLFRLPDQRDATIEVEVAGPPLEGAARVRIAPVGGRMLVFPLRGGVQPLLPADGVAAPGAGGRARVTLMPERPRAPSLVVFGCDPAFALVADALRREADFEVLWAPLGSRASLEALARGEAHVAGVHLLDAESGEFNGPWVRRLVPFPCTRIGFSAWEETLMMRSSHASQVRTVQDLARPGLRFLNREPGSGTRALLDRRLATAGVPVAAIPGYGETAASGHLAVAESIASGAADAGIGIRAAALAFGLHAVTLEEERYDLVVPNHFLELPAVQALIDLLGRGAIRRQVAALGGYDVRPMGLPA